MSYLQTLLKYIEKYIFLTKGFQDVDIRESFLLGIHSDRMGPLSAGSSAYENDEKGKS
jgi:hypothetical protein